MSDHIVELLGAYLDGELHGSQLQKVQAHLDECQACRQEYASLQALSAVLGEASLPDFPSPEHFAEDVVLRMQRKPVDPMRGKVMEIGWWLAPIGLITMWIIIGMKNLVGNMVSIASGIGLLDSASAWLVFGTSRAIKISAWLDRFGLLEQNNLQWLTVSENFTRKLISSIFWQVAIAMLFLSWIAVLWAHHMRQGLGQPLEN